VKTPRLRQPETSGPCHTAASMRVFSKVPTYEWLDDNEFAFVLRHEQPIRQGHTLIITKRAVPTWFEATHEERLAILDLIERVKRALDAVQPRPDGYNVRFEAGEAAGQTVMHLHVHVIPRRFGDTDPPPVPQVPSPPALDEAIEPRQLPDLALDRARERIDAFLERSGGNGTLQQHGGRRARVLGRAPEGGVRIVGPDTNFTERTVPELEIAWAIATEDDVERHGGLLDEVRVRRFRQLDGTPGDWVDTGWALALLRGSRAAERPREAQRRAEGPRCEVSDQQVPIDSNHSRLGNPAPGASVG
jgi:diadenosine tetraphosphate (Ap4A) HIT family hydrolase